jgi:crotonobetainyl-CoA:carnitine CoA-transferase CaiB-like acyl-CoA transferase
MGILNQYRVVDMAQFIAGSRCTQILGDMGAQVVHVEPPEGEILRLIFRLVGSGEKNYSILNRNKYGLSVDWRRPEGQKVIKDLLAGTDIFVHNLIPGNLEKYGLGYEDVRRVKKDIIYVAISGFGTRSPHPERAAFDIIAQATSGQFWKDLENLAPPTNHWADFMSGAYGALSALLALIHRLHTGQGQFVDVSMQDVLYFNNYRAMANKALGQTGRADLEKTLGRRPEDVLNSPDRMPFYGFFKSADGKVAIVAMTPRQWKDLSAICERPELATDHRFSNILAQIHHHQEAVDIIEEWTAKHPSKEILDLLENKKIPCGIAYGIEEVNRDANLEARGMFHTVQHKTLGPIEIPGIPYQFSESPGTISRPAPDLGEHNREILGGWLGYSAEEMKRLEDDGIIR